MQDRWERKRSSIAISEFFYCSIAEGPFWNWVLASTMDLVIAILRVHYEGFKMMNAVHKERLANRIRTRGSLWYQTTFSIRATRNELRSKNLKEKFNFSKTEKWTRSNFRRENEADFYRRIHYCYFRNSREQVLCTIGQLRTQFTEQYRWGKGPFQEGKRQITNWRRVQRVVSQVECRSTRVAKATIKGQKTKLQKYKNTRIVLRV